jgi:hypothetical protein
MLDDADVAEVINWQYEKMAQKAIHSLEKNNIHAEYAVDRAEALSKLIEAIPREATIGIGDSVTLHQIGFYQWLNKQTDRVVLNPFVRNPETGKLIYTPAEHFAMLQKALIADVYLTSTNALTLDGKLVSLDGRGNRVAAMLFGPKKVVLVTGANKIVKDLDEAMLRMETAAPLNGRRHQIKHGSDKYEKFPCIAAGRCSHCKTSFRMCRKWVIIDGQSLDVMAPEESGISVIIVGESLGF